MVEPHGARHVDAAMDGVDPGRAGIGNDDRPSCRGWRCPCRMPRRGLSVFCASASPPSGTDTLDLEIGPLARHLGDRLRDHPARHGVDGRLAGRDRQAGPRHQPDALAAPEGDAGARPRRAAPCSCTSAPCVTSGSSPASLTMPAMRPAVAQSRSPPARRRRVAAGQRRSRPDRESPARAAPSRRPWPPPWRRRRSSSRASAGALRFPDSAGFAVHAGVL